MKFAGCNVGIVQLSEMAGCILIVNVMDAWLSLQIRSFPFTVFLVKVAGCSVIGQASHSGGNYDQGLAAFQ